MLFNAQKLPTKTATSSPKGAKTFQAAMEVKNAFHKKQDEIEKVICKLTEGTVLRYVTEGQWSMVELIKYAVLQTGEPCEVYLTSWALSEDAVETLFALHQKGLITGLYCVFDYKIRDNKAKPLQFLSSFATYSLTKIHAKVSVILGKTVGYSIHSSANLTANDRIETGTIFCNYELALQDQTWITKLLKN